MELLILLNVCTTQLKRYNSLVHVYITIVRSYMFARRFRTITVNRYAVVYYYWIL